MSVVKGLFVLNRDAFDLVYGPDERAAIARHVELVGEPQSRETLAEQPELLRDAEVLISGWGAPVLDDQFLKTARKLQAVFYGGGAVGSFMTESAWERGILVTSAAEANAIPVAEYTLAMILFSLKHGWALSRQTREQRTFPGRDGAPGCYGSSVGLISLGFTARKLLKLLRPYELKVIAYDPYISPIEARRLGVTLVSLEELFELSDVVSLHTPLLPETVNMVRGRHLATMKKGATFINTARGQVVNENEMTGVLSRRPDLHAVLDVTCHEPPHADSPLYTLPNVTLTPHIAGSAGAECRRMGRYMVEEIRRYVNGRPLKYLITPEVAANSSHRPMTLSVRPTPVISQAVRHRKAIQRQNLVAR